MGTPQIETPQHWGPGIPRTICRLFRDSGTLCILFRDSEILEIQRFRDSEILEIQRFRNSEISKAEDVLIINILYSTHYYVGVVGEYYD